MNKYIIGGFFLIISTLSACGIYSFTGANISPDIKTISIEYFYNESGGGPPNLSPLFTEGIKEYFQNNTNLGIDNTGNGDLQITGNIVSYSYRPIAPVVTGNNENDPNDAGLERLTIGVRVQYMNIQDDSYDFDQQFSFYADYDPNTTDISTVEPLLVEEILTQLYVDIFNASVANW